MKHQHKKNHLSQTPIISVIMSVYNNIEYIEDAVDSILNQTYRDFEFIILEDGSNDGSREKLIEYSEQDARIKLIQNEKNKGLTKNLNHGLDIAQGKYIARMDGDDIAMPTRFEEQVKHFEADGELVLIGTGYYTIDNNTERYRLTLDSYDKKVTTWLSIFTPPLMHPSSMYRKSLMELGLRYDEKTFPAEDFDFWSRIMQHGTCYLIPKPLIDYRLHDNNISATRRGEQLKRSAEIVQRNISYYFDENVAKSTDVIKLLGYLYSDDSFSFSDVWHAATTMKKLLVKFSNSFELTNEQRKQIYMLGARWVTKKVINKGSKYSFKLLALLPLASSILAEAKAYGNRHKKSQLS
jgi:glycosyltransferase involved in cell wall biosynthesis